MKQVDAHLKDYQSLRDDLANKINKITQNLKDLRNDDH